MTAREELARRIEADRRNLDALPRMPHRIAEVVADCAARLMASRRVGRDLEQEAEGNLIEALSWWRA